MLEMRNISRTFPGVIALDNVDFTLRAGEVHALMGENGAGKSTLIKVMTGVHPATAGTITLDGKIISPRNTSEAQKVGISTVYQEVNLVPNLSVAENIFLARQPKLLGKIRWREMNKRAEAALSRLDLKLDVKQLLSSYSIAIQQMVAIARALDISAKILVLDEPTSSLSADEVTRLFRLIRNLKQQGLGILFVSHFLNQVYEISDRITVLRNGRLVGEYLAAELPKRELVAKMMGRELAEFESTQHDTTQQQSQSPLIALNKVSSGKLNKIGFDVNKGEVVGLAGLLGSGRTESANLLFGIDHPTSGSIAIDGQAKTIRSPRKAIRQGIAMLPEDRKLQGILPDLTVRENIVVALQGRRGFMRFLPRRKQNELAGKYIKALNIATRDAETPIKTLSGGNQQKALIARWLAADPRFLILDEPTRGIDVGAKAEILKLILSLAKEGMGILLISSELEEICRCASRVIVLRDREKVGELTGSQINESSIISTIAGKQG